MVRSQREIFRRMDFRGRTEMRLFPGHTGLQSMGDGAGLSVTKGQHMMVCVRERFVSANQGGTADRIFVPDSSDTVGDFLFYMRSR